MRQSEAKQWPEWEIQIDNDSAKLPRELFNLLQEHRLPMPKFELQLSPTDVRVVEVQDVATVEPIFIPGDQRISQ